MKKRDFLKTSAVLTFGTLISPLSSCSTTKAGVTSSSEKNRDDVVKAEDKPAAPQFTPFELPALGYAFDALVPHIDARTMEIHHGKHHAAYTKNFNAALEKSALAGKTLNEILAALEDKDSDIALRNNGGGYYNHNLFWTIIGPNKGGLPTGDLAAAINQTFGSFENFSTKFKDAAKNRFGSGWAWLIKDANGKLAVTDTANQDNPLMPKIVQTTGKPIIALDVWEHAYYLNYQNKRADYINAFFNIVDWDAASKNFG
jgi:Fe-Mn family superoxide dismutase